MHWTFLTFRAMNLNGLDCHACQAITAHSSLLFAIWKSLANNDTALLVIPAYYPEQNRFPSKYFELKCLHIQKDGLSANIKWLKINTKYVNCNFSLGRWCWDIKFKFCNLFYLTFLKWNRCWSSHGYHVILWICLLWVKCHKDIN